MNAFGMLRRRRGRKERTQCCGETQTSEQGTNTGCRFLRVDEAHRKHVDHGDNDCDDPELHAGYQPAHQFRGNRRVDSHEPQHAKTDDSSHNRAADVGQVGAHNERGIDEAIAIANPTHRNQTLNDAAHRFAKSRADDPPTHARRKVDRPPDDDLQNRGDNAHEEHGFCVLVSEEDALAHQHDSRRGHAGHEGNQDQRVGRDQFGPGRIGDDQLHHRGSACHEDRGSKNRQGGDEANTRVVVLGNFLVVIFGDCVVQSCEDCGRKRNSDDRLREHEDQKCSRISGQTRDGLGILVEVVIRNRGDGVR